VRASAEAHHEGGVRRRNSGKEKRKLPGEKTQEAKPEKRDVPARGERPKRDALIKKEGGRGRTGKNFEVTTAPQNKKNRRGRQSIIRKTGEQKMACAGEKLGGQGSPTRKR